MPLPTGLLRRARRGFTARRLGVVLAVTASVAASAASPANAGQIDQKRSEIAQVQNELHALDQQSEAAGQALDRAQLGLTRVEARVRANTARLKIARANLAAARRQLAAFLVSSYKTGSPDAFAVLGTGSFTTLLDRVDFLHRMSRAEGELVHQVRAAEHEIATRQAELKAEEAQARRLVREAQQRRAAALAAARQREQLLNGLQGDLRRLIARRQAWLDRLAQERAARLAARRAAAAQAAAQAAAEQKQAAAPAPSQAPPPVAQGGGGGGWSPPPAGSLGEQAVAIAQRYLGVPYVWGGASPSGFDCSGLTMYVYAQLGIHLDHYTGSQWLAGPHVSMSQLQPGDLVFFYPGEEHVGIYMGGGLFIHAPHTGDVVRISALGGYYASVFDGGVRLTG